MVFYWNNDVFKRAFICFMYVMAIFATNLNISSQELFKNKNEEVNFIDNIRHMSYLAKKHCKDDKYEKLFEIFFTIQNYEEKITGKTFSIKEIICKLDKALQKEGKFLSESRLAHLDKFLNKIKKIVMVKKLDFLMNLIC